MALPSEELEISLSPEQLALHRWLYRVTRNHAVATFLFGFMLRVATDNQSWTFWQVLEEVKQRVQIEE